MTLLQQIRDFDRQRPSVPGEHILTAAAGSWLLRSAMRRRSVFGQALTALAGGALLYRAASGRDGVASLARERTAPLGRYARPGSRRGYAETIDA